MNFGHVVQTIKVSTQGREPSGLDVQGAKPFRFGIQGVESLKCQNLYFKRLIISWMLNYCKIAKY